MAVAGDFYTVRLKEAHLRWGLHRYTCTRDPIYGEGYIKIPIHKARAFNIYNSNYRGDSFSYNLFNCASSDGFYRGVLKAQGCSSAGDIYAKQFSADDNLKVFLSTKKSSKYKRKSVAL